MLKLERLLKVNKVILFLFLVSFTLSCKKGKVTEFVILSGISNINLDTINLSTHQRFYLNSQKKESYVIKPDSKHKFLDTLIISKGYYELIAGNKTIPLYLKQGFNLNIDLMESDVIINGNGSVENRYLQAKKDLESNIASINFYQYYSYLDEARFLKYVDSIKTLRDNLIKSYNLSNNHFKFIEESYSKLDRTHKLIKYPITRINFDTNYIPSKNFPIVFNDININDERLFEVPLFKVLMYTKILIKNESQSNLENDESLNLLRLAISDELNVTNQVVKEQLAFTIADWTIEGTDSLDLFYKIFKDFTKNEDDLKKITSKYLYMKGLSNGNQAPNFEFYNEKDELISLESLNDYVIYLDIWATWCKPCIEEIGPSNKLQKKLSNKKIKFISVCIESKKESWSRIIKEKEFSGIQLFCPKTKEDIFKENYLVESLPRYLIIDKNGKIHDFNARKPSDNELEQELLKLL
jgi:thiol-disulfide isomerase/thioredoxin